MTRIGLIGCAGLGKSLIAGTLSKELRIPFIDSKSITRPFLAESGYVYDGRTFVEQFLSTREDEIVSRRIALEDEKQNFVTDRTTIECFCYAFLGLGTYTDEAFSAIEDKCLENARKYTHLYLFPFESGWFEDNGVRTMNSHFQWLIDNTIRGIIRKWDLKVTEIPKSKAIPEKAVKYIINDIGLNF